MKPAPRQLILDIKSRSKLQDSRQNLQREPSCRMTEFSGQILSTENMGWFFSVACRCLHIHVLVFYLTVYFAIVTLN